MRSRFLTILLLVIASSLSVMLVGCNDDEAIECVINSECESDGNDCTDDLCREFHCVTIFRDEGVSCGSGENTTCDGEGHCSGCINDEECDGGVCDEGVCVECVDDSDCEDENDCTTNTCDDNECVEAFVDSGIGCGGEDDVCDGAGECVECASASNCDDENPCTLNECADNECDFSGFEELGVDCGEGLICDGAGQCIMENPQGSGCRIYQAEHPNYTTVNQDAVLCGNRYGPDNIETACYVGWHVCLESEWEVRYSAGMDPGGTLSSWGDLRSERCGGGVWVSSAPTSLTPDAGDYCSLGGYNPQNDGKYLFDDDGESILQGSGNCCSYDSTFSPNAHDPLDGSYMAVYCCKDDCTMDADCADSNECTADTCVEGACDSAFVAEGESCTGGVCDGAGSCVECIDISDCDLNELCINGECIVGP